MVLNKHLYAALIERFGDVKIYNEGAERIEERVPGSSPVAVQKGESYNVDCPVCGDDRQRLSISYMWLERPLTRSQLIRHLVHCYNEECEQSSEMKEFTDEMIKRVKDLKLFGVPEDIERQAKSPAHKGQRGAIPLPKGCVPLKSLNKDHPAIRFLASKYKGFTSQKLVSYLSDVYEAKWTESHDELFPAAQDRIIFPIRNGHAKQVAWQGRVIDPDINPRWFLPPGFVKVFYNMHRVSEFEIPILTEGIMNAIFCGPNGIAMFGKTLNSIRAEELGTKYSTVIIATDPDTFVKDNRKGGGGKIYVDLLKKTLEGYVRHIRTIRWPQEILDLAERHNNGEDVAVPDAADLGMKTMRRLIKEVS